MTKHTISPDFQLNQNYVSSSILRPSSTGIPRLAAMIWQSLIGAKYSRSYLHSKLTAIESLYEYDDTVHVHPSLDHILVGLEFATLEFRLKGFLAHLQNKTTVQNKDHSRTWQSVVDFVTETLDFLLPIESPRSEIASFKSSLRRIERMYNFLKPLRNLRPAKLRALPADVIEDLYKITALGGPSNPFRTPKLQVRNHSVFLLLLHLGLRKGEILTLRADVIKHEYDRNKGRDRFWLNIIPSNILDIRKRQPSLKNQGSIRQLPLTGELANVLWNYLHNWRGRCPHGFFFNSEQNKPLSLRAVSYVVEKLNNALSTSSKKILRMQRNEDGLSMHDFRHTCAIVRLKGFLSRGVPMDEAELAIHFRRLGL